MSLTGRAGSSPASATYSRTNEPGSAPGPLELGKIDYFLLWHCLIDAWEFRVWTKPDKTRDRAFLVTGASTGIGAASRLDLDGRGFRVFAGIRREEDGRRIQEQATPRLTPVTLDVTDAATIAAAAETIAAAVGAAGLAGLVNNAGIAVAGPLELLPTEQVRRQFEVNVIGQIAVTQAMLPLLRCATGRIVNIGSLNGFLSPPHLASYAASKFALEAITDSLRVELRHWGILVSIVEPGVIQTPIREKSRSQADHTFDQLTPERQALYAEDIAAVRAATERLALKARRSNRCWRPSATP